MSFCWAARSYWNCCLCNVLFFIFITYWTNISVWNDIIFVCEFFLKFWGMNCFSYCLSLNCKYFKKQGKKGIRKKMHLESLWYVNNKVHSLSQSSNTWLFSLKLVLVHLLLCCSFRFASPLPAIFVMPVEVQWSNICTLFFFSKCIFVWLQAKVLEIWKPVCLSRNVGHTCRINIYIVIT